MAIIEIEGLAKSYRVYQKKEGLAASLKGLFRRRYREVKAVGRIRCFSGAQRGRQDDHAEVAFRSY